MALTTVHSASRFTLASVLGLLLAAQPALAQEVGDEEEDLSQIIVTATAIRQGGAQDIRHFRSVSLDGSFLPPASSLTLEGLMGEHDLSLPENARCRQLFCLTGHAMQAALPGRPDDRWFVGLGFASNIDAEAMRGEPLSLIAVVDRSGSMDGEPITRVKEALHAALGKMRRGDRLGIVIYGTDSLVHLQATDIESNRAEIARAIEAIEIDGSTSLEAGLRLGYQTAFAELARSRGKTRLMLFTDENPNTGDTSAEGFIGQALAGAERGVGLTTIGVGVHFDAELATKVSSVRGGNLFFLDEELPARTLYDREFFNMVSEVAHDIAIELTPPAGYRISGVFGVPEGMMESGADGTVKVKIGSAFLSSNGGGIYAALAGEPNLPSRVISGGETLLTARLAYADSVRNENGSDVIEVRQASAAATPPGGLAKAQVLVDEYLSLTSALDLYHAQGDKKGAYHALNGLATRLDAARLSGLGEERKLVSGLRDRAAFLAGFRGEAPRSMRPLALVGEWRVIAQSGLRDVARGDDVEITSDAEMLTQRNSGRDEGEEITQSIQVNESQLVITEESLRFDYRIRGDVLTLTTPDGLASMRLRRVSEDTAG